MACRRLVPALLAGLLMIALAGEALGAPTLRSPTLRGVAKKVAVRTPTAPPPVELSAGGVRPDILVDGAGTSHIVWNESAPDAPDTTVYCRVPRNARACDITQRLVPPGADALSQDSEGPEVVAVNDQVAVLSHRFPQPVPKPGDDGSQSDNTLWLWTSDDGGRTFTEGGVVATGTIGGGAVVYGRAANPSVGAITGVVTGGVTFTGVQGGRFVLRGGQLAAGDFVNARIAARDGVPSIVYADTALTSTFIRSWTDTGDPNDPATWTAPQVVPGTDPDIAAAGSRLLVLNEDSAGRLFLRDAAGGAAVPVSTGSAGTGRVIGYPDGRASLVWNGAEGLTRGIFRRDLVVPGVAPRGTPTLISTVEGIFPEAAAAADGGGTVVTEEGRRILLSAFGTGAPTGRPGLGAAAAALPPLAPDVSVACQKVGFGAVQAELQEGCFLAAQTGRARVSTGPLRLNGLEIIPDAGVQVIVDPAARTIRSTGTVTVLLRAPGIPDITLFRGSIQIDANGKGAGDSLIKWAEGLFRPNLLGFPLAGDIDVRLTNGGVKIPVSVRLPAAFGNIRGAAELVADNRRGLVLESLDFSADGVPLGPANLRRLRVQYKASGGTSVGDCLRPPTSGASAQPNEWAGVFELELPPPKTGPAVCGSIRFGDGAFRAATFSISLPYPGIVLFPGVSLTRLGGGLSLEPTEISASATLGIIPAGNGALLNLDGRIDVRIADPLIIRGAATVTAAGVPIGDGTFTLSTDGYVAVRVNTGPKIGPLAVQSSLAGFADGPRQQFSLSAKGEICIADVCAPNAQGVVSTKGIAVCLPSPLVPRGAGYTWGSPLIGGVEIFTLSCYADSYAVGDARAMAVAQAVAESGVDVPGGVPDVTFRVAGEGGVPAVDLIGPDGAVVTPANVVTDPAGIVYLAVTPAPAPGRWTVRARPGSPLIAQVATSSSLPAPRVADARVTGAGRARVLRYRATLAPGQSIAFVERGAAGTRVLGAASAGAGRLGFAPGPGAGGRREIAALLSQDGRVVEEVPVASYVAPPPPRAGRASGLAARRAGARVVATWRPGAAAAAQRLSAVIAGGQRVQRLLGPRARRAVVAGVDGRRIAVTVTAIARDGRAGRPARTSLAPARGARR